LTDGQLLKRFADPDRESSESAFAAVVGRHGPMVFRACRSITLDEHDAEDAYQATFLILAKRHRTLWIRDSLGPWLHRVACRAATRARVAAERRKKAERAAAESAKDRIEIPAVDDGAGMIHEEIDRLPERHRVPIVLCDVEGLTHDDAARLMGCPVGTVKSRLARGRARMRCRLVRRGLAPAASTLAIGLVTRSAQACVPAALPRVTSRAVAELLAAGGTGGPSPATVGVLVNGVTQAMYVAKLGKIAVAGLILATAAIGGGLLMPDRGVRRAAADDAPVASKIAGRKDDLDEIQGVWTRVSTDGRKPDGVVKMTVQRRASRPEDDVPEGAAMFTFDWDRKARAAIASC